MAHHTKLLGHTPLNLSLFSLDLNLLSNTVERDWDLSVNVDRTILLNVNIVPKVRV
jgi:hypothetical protein